jgi:hypothetical protein
MKQTKFLAIVLIATGSLGSLYCGFTYSKGAQIAQVEPIELTVMNTETVSVPKIVNALSPSSPQLTSTVKRVSRSYRLPYRSWPEPRAKQGKHTRALSFTLFLLFIRQAVSPSLHQRAAS